MAFNLLETINNMIAAPAKQQAEAAAARRVPLDAIKNKYSQDAQGPAPLQMEDPSKIQSYQAKQISGPLPEYDYARQKANEQINSSQSQNADALKRRFATLGGLNSGAAIKAQQLNDQAADQQRESALGGIGAQEAQARREMQSQEDNKAYQSSEQAKSQVATRNFQREMTNNDNGWKAKVFNFDKDSKLYGLDQAFQQMEMQRDEDEFNKRLEKYKAGHSGGLFGGGGFLGTGIGASSAEF